jgi:hypothetical protein
VEELVTSVARFFLVQTDQSGENTTSDHKLYQMAIKYTKCIILNGQTHVDKNSLEERKKTKKHSSLNFFNA